MNPKLSPIAQWLSSILLLIIAGIGLTACAILPPPIANLIPSPTPPPTSTPTPSPTATPTATPTPTPQPIVRVQEADHELFNGNWDEARNLYSTALDQQPDPAVAAAARFGLATVNLRAGNIESAAGDFTLYLQAYATDSRIPDAYFQLGNIAQAQGTWGVAIQNYQQYLALRPGVIDSYVWERIGRCYIEWGKPTSAVEAYSQAILTDRAGGLTPLIEKKADLLQQQGDYAGALALYDLVATSTDSHLTLARMDILRGRMNLLLGHTEQAQQFFQHAVDTYPETYDSYRSLIALIDAGVTVNEFQRGLINYYAGQNELALAAFNRYIAATPTPEAGVYYYAGLARRALNQPTGAIANFDQLIEHDPQSPLWAEAWTEKAYTQWAWADDYNGAIATLEKFATAAPENAAVPDALFQAGRIAERQGNLSRAAALWTSVNTRYPNTATAAEGAFFAGVSLYREASYDLAVAQFTLAAEHPAANAERKAAAWLWLAKTQRQRGATEAAATAFGQAEAADPGGYYSLRATEIKEDEAPFPPVTTYDLSFDYLKEKSEAEAWLAAKLGLDPSRDLGALSPQLAADGHWLRGHELWALGLTAEAKLEFSELRQAYASDPLLLYQLALALRELGAYSETINAARASVDALGFTDSFAAPPFFTHLRFGAYYFDLVTKAATDYDLDPLLLYAVIRKESLFEGSIVSSASAQGLMQVIPTTGEWVAQQLHWPHYQNSDLYRPYINVEFGAYYLDYQRDYLGGNIVAALAAYNAGPGNAEKWWAASHDDPDLFLEITRLDEPRRYIRSIYEFYEIYRKLYGK